MITVFGSLKGGSGKSTLAFNLGVWLAMADEPVITLDLDPQATLSDVVELREEERYEPSIVVKSLSGLREELRQHVGEVLIDVGTANMEAMKQAILMADRVIVPVSPSQADIWSTQRFVRMVRELTAGSRGLEIMGFINRADTHRAVIESDEAAAALVAMPGVKFIKRRLYQRTIYRRSFSEGLAVFEMDPRSKAANEVTSLGAVLYPNLVR